MNTEMMRLRNSLDKKLIPWVDKSDVPYFYRTEFICADTKWMVTSGRAVNDCESGLLELISLVVHDGEPIKNLTSADIIELAATCTERTFSDGQTI